MITSVTFHTFDRMRERAILEAQIWSLDGVADFVDAALDDFIKKRNEIDEN